MPKATLPPWLSEVHGKIGDVVFKRTKKGEIIVTKAPDMSKVKWSPAQKAYRQRFKKAITYARAAMANPRIRRSMRNGPPARNGSPSASPSRIT